MSTILVVDDDLQLRRFLRTTLSGHGHSVVEAGSVAEAVGKCLGLGGVAADELDSVAVLESPGAYGGSHVARADDADGGHDVGSFAVRDELVVSVLPA